MNKRLIGIVGAAVSTALAISGCTSSDSGSGTNPGTSTGGNAAETQQGGTLTVLTDYTSYDMDPAISVQLSTEPEGLVTRRLTTLDFQPGQDAEIVPDLATDIGTPSDDGKTWTYTLKDGITFQDGTPITSADIKYGLERSFAPDLAGGLSYHKQLLEGAADYTGPYDGKELASIETPDDKTIIFHLNSPSGDWPAIASGNPFSPVPKAADTDPATYGQAPVASGPYQVESNKDGQETVLVRNKNWDPATDDVRTAGPDKIVIKQSQNVTTATQSIIADAGDAANSITENPLGAAELALVNANPDAKKRLITSDAGSLYYIAMNNDSGPLQDPRVRQALEYAIDRKSIIVSQGGAQAAAPATTMIIPGIPGRKDFDLYPAGDSGDVDKAKELLEQAGYDGTPLVMWVANSDAWQAAAEAVQQGLERAGINVDIQPMDEGAMYGDIHGGSGKYDLLLTYWVPDFPSATAILPLMFNSQEIESGFNFAHYSNPDVDKLLNQAVGEVDPAKAEELWGDLDERIMQDAPVLPLYYLKYSYLGGSNVQNHFVAPYPPIQNYLRISVAK
jgi:peptide/nickel transport system substrate-binding protein